MNFYINLANLICYVEYIRLSEHNYCMLFYYTTNNNNNDNKYLPSSKGVPSGLQKNKKNKLYNNFMKWSLSINCKLTAAPVITT